MISDIHIIKVRYIITYKYLKLNIYYTPTHFNLKILVC